MNDQVGIASILGQEIDICGNSYDIRAVRNLSKFGRVTFSKLYRFKRTEYAIHFF